MSTLVDVWKEEGYKENTVYERRNKLPSNKEKRRCMRINQTKKQLRKIEIYILCTWNVGRHLSRSL